MEQKLEPVGGSTRELRLSKSVRILVKVAFVARIHILSPDPSLCRSPANEELDDLPGVFPVVDSRRESYAPRCPVPETNKLARRSEVEQMTLWSCLPLRTGTRIRPLEHVQMLLSERSLLLPHANLTSFGPAIEHRLAHHEDIIPLDRSCGSRGGI